MGSDWVAQYLLLESPGLEDLKEPDSLSLHGFLSPSSPSVFPFKRNFIWLLRVLVEARGIFKL